MAESDLSITPPSISKSASIATIGKEWGAVGPTGASSFDLPMPASNGRGWDPQLSLHYSSQTGNGIFGLGWGLGLPSIGRRTQKGVPRYTDHDEIIGDDGEVWFPELNDDGSIKSREESIYNGLDIGLHDVVRYFPRVESSFALREQWRSHVDPRVFWLIHAADGSLHAYGTTNASRCADPDDPQRISTWLLCESLNHHGEHICYQYKADDQDPYGADDPRAQRYLQFVLYGNANACADLYAWTTENFIDLDWHFHLVFDYGERSPGYTDKPKYDGDAPWLLRPDPFSTYGHGFDLHTRRRCQQVLMFHQFRIKTGSVPVLVRRLLFEYGDTAQAWNYSLLKAAHYQAWGPGDSAENSPPVEFEYSSPKINKTPAQLFKEQTMPAIEDGGHYQCVDLFGESVPGFLCRYDNAWYYREPVHNTVGSNDIEYAPWAELKQFPISASNPNERTLLTDLVGNGRLDIIKAQHGLNGFHSLNADRSWTLFTLFTRFPIEFFHTLAQFSDMAGDGLASIALIGPQSVRVYANQREQGFAPAEDVQHTPSDDRLPLFSDSRSELVILGNLLGSDMPELCRIRHNEIKCWPNLGHGKFAQGRVISDLPFNYEEFDTQRVRIADIDGSGASALIYLLSDGFDIYRNRGGNGLEQIPIHVPWPSGIRYDHLCQVTLVDRLGTGCASLILTVTHMKAQHWCYDFEAAKPYLLIASNNNMGCSASVTYRSSAQEWLDEKCQRLAQHPEQVPACHLPFAVQVVSTQSQLDEVTGNRLTQLFDYREGYYDSGEREFRGFGHLQQVDSESASPDDDASFSAPVRVETWYHTGALVDASREQYFNGDPEAWPLGNTLFSHYHVADQCDQPVTVPIDAEHEIARALAGSIMRVETYAADDDPATAQPFSAQEHRYLVREVRPKGQHDPARVLLPLALETIRYAYDRVINDPLVAKDISLCWNRYGQPTHNITVNYARRLTELSPPPFTDPDEQTWWLNAHDENQQCFYLSETRTELIDQDSNLQEWLLGLAYRHRGNAWVLPKGTLPTGLTPTQVSYEHLSEHTDSDHFHRERMLTQQSVQRYLKSTDQSLLPDGVADFVALKGPLEIAQMDKTALQAYSDLSNFDIRTQLQQIGFRAMPFLFRLKFEDDSERNLWSTRYNFVKYFGLERFYQVQAFQETPSHGETKALYDDFALGLANIELPDGCTTRIEHNYFTLSPATIIDANDNTEEVIFTPTGQPLATSFYGTENGQPAGFKPLSQFQPPEDLRPEPAIDDPGAAVQEAASTLRHDLFCWMGKPSVSAAQLRDWVDKGWLLPNGYIRASARLHLLRATSLTAEQQALQIAIAQTHREPVYSVLLQPDRDSHDPQEPQIQISKICVDGFGRTLQIQQRVEPGMAYVADEDGSLIVEDGKLLEAFAEKRWRCSERIDHNNKGLPVRQYRPYFVNTYRYVNDKALREHDYFSLLFYDQLGRLTKEINAVGDFALTAYHPWYKTYQDANDTAEPPPAKSSRTLH